MDDPFQGTGFAALRQPAAPLQNFDARGMESVPYDCTSRRWASCATPAPSTRGPESLTRNLRPQVPAQFPLEKLLGFGRQILCVEEVRNRTFNDDPPRVQTDHARGQALGLP